MESDAFYMVDDTGMEVALGLNATLRDYASLVSFTLIKVIGMANKLFLNLGSTHLTILMKIT